jgi:hypothetical protein
MDIETKKKESDYEIFKDLERFSRTKKEIGD